MISSRDIRPWHWLTILSLDAPVVALVWQAFLARGFDVELAAVHRAVLGLTVWLAYVADRWLDARRLALGDVVTTRHAFARRFARPIAVAWVLVLIADVLLALAGLSRRELVAGLGLGAAVLGYLALAQSKSWLRRVAWFKEVAVAVLMAGGASLFILVADGSPRSTSWLASLVFLVLCLLNCILVAIWEREVDRRQGQVSAAVHFGLKAQQVRVASLGLLMSLAAGAVLSPTPLPQVCLAGIVTVIGVLILLSRGGRIGLETRRLLADATLLSPWLVMPWR